MSNKRKVMVSYVPHGINSSIFFPIDETSDIAPQFEEFKQKLFSEKNIEFVVFWNSRNIHRKHPADVILSYRMFCDSIGKEKAKKCALILHTQIVDSNGTNLRAVKEAFCDPSYVKVFFSEESLTSSQMNLLYNVADVTMLISSNEGWGLSLTESMMAGTMIVGNVSGGMQDQMGFRNEKGEWIDFSSEFPSNHRGTYRDCGEWAIPVFPSNLSIAGSPGTPYIFDDRCRPEDVAAALEEVFKLSPEERKRRGRKGREWVLSEEAKMNAKAMSQSMIKNIDKAFEEFEPRKDYELFKIQNRPSKYINHRLIGY